jgi:hypothetical protein
MPQKAGSVLIMADFLRSSDLNKTSVEFLMTDLETGLTFMDVAQTSVNQQT